MKKSSLSLALAALSAAICVSGCDSFKSRAKEKSAVYASLPTGTQHRLERGNIRVGDSPDMVYIALGNPDEKRDIMSATGIQTIWIYKAYWQEYEGTAQVGWRSVIVPTDDHRGYVIFHEPVTQEIYSPRADDVIRVTFTKGAVTSVDQQRP